MKNLWMKTPPYMADTFGMQDVVSLCEGMGIIDDSSGYRAGRGSRFTAELVSSGIKMEDVITGTQNKIVAAFRRRAEGIQPGFVLLCAAPAASMIGTDLEDTARIIEEESKIPTMAVGLTGHKAYDNGISKSYEALAKRIIEPADSHDGSINVLGFNTIDFSQQAEDGLREYLAGMCRECGIRITSWWGGDSADVLKNAAKASCNLVVSASGLAAAKYMKKTFGIPYIAAAPMGAGMCEELQKALQGGSMEMAENTGDTPEVIIVGEQLLSNAIRYELLTRFHRKNVRVLNYFIMDKSLMLDGDKRMKDEEALEEAIRESGCRLVIGNPAIRPLVPEGVKWIGLPSNTFIWKAGEEEQPDLTGAKLDQWLQEQLSLAGETV